MKIYDFRCVYFLIFIIVDYLNVVIFIFLIPSNSSYLVCACIVLLSVVSILARIVCVSI